MINRLHPLQTADQQFGNGFQIRVILTLVLSKRTSCELRSRSDKAIEQSGEDPCVYNTAIEHH